MIFTRKRFAKYTFRFCRCVGWMKLAGRVWRWGNLGRTYCPRCGRLRSRRTLDLGNRCYDCLVDQVIEEDS